MIYVSSTCVKATKIKDAVEALAKSGFRYIELSGGTQFYPGYADDLENLRNKYQLNYRLHNYFPPPEKSFVLNLCSADKDVEAKSFSMVRAAVEMSAKYGAKEYGLHAGFRMSPSSEELGQQIRERRLMDYNSACRKFIDSYKLLNEEALKKGVALYIENNVFSDANFKSFQGENPFLLTTYGEYEELSRMNPFSLLLDVAHLKVSCHTLKLDYVSELRSFLARSDYIHVSDNDRTHDSNNSFSETSDFYQVMKETKLNGKSFTIEVYEDLPVLRDCYERMSKLIA